MMSNTEKNITIDEAIKLLMPFYKEAGDKMRDIGSTYWQGVEYGIGTCIGELELERKRRQHGG